MTNEKWDRAVAPEEEEAPKINYLQETLRLLEDFADRSYNTNCHDKAKGFRKLREKMEEDYGLEPKPVPREKYPGDCTLS